MNESTLGFLVVLAAMLVLVVAVVLAFGPTIAGAIEAWRGLVP